MGEFKTFMFLVGVDTRCSFRRKIIKWQLKNG